MADASQKISENVEGTFYVDDTCIDCGVCVETAPAHFRRNEDEGYAYVHVQPTEADGEAQVREAMEECPVEAIGDDG